MNIKDILATIGLGDGEGNTSSTRLILLLAAIGWLAYKIRNNEAFGTDNDRWMLGIILGGGIGKTIAESVGITTSTTQPTK